MGLSHSQLHEELAGGGKRVSERVGHQPNGLARLLVNYDEAEKVLKEAIRLNEWSSGAYILLGQIALKKGDSGIAVGFLERALKLDPQNYWVHYFLAKAYHNSISRFRNR